LVLNNNGYLLIRLTQDNFLSGRHIGTDKDTGVSFPNLEKVAMSYGIKYLQLTHSDDWKSKVNQIFTEPGPMICEVISPSDQILIPRVASKILEDGSMISMPYDDMFPFLPRDEYSENSVREKNL
jgi:acetolactate synthase-1/2/3 large subunit